MGIRELSVYSYKEGDSKVNEKSQNFNKTNFKAGSGSYVSGEMYNEKEQTSNIH